MTSYHRLHSISRQSFDTTLMMHSTIELVIPFLNCLVFCIGCGCNIKVFSFVYCSSYSCDSARVFTLRRFSQCVTWHLPGESFEFFGWTAHGESFEFLGAWIGLQIVWLPIDRSKTCSASLQLLCYVISSSCSCVNASYRSAHYNDCADISSTTSLRPFLACISCYYSFIFASSIIPNLVSSQLWFYKQQQQCCAVTTSTWCHHSIAPRILWLILESPLVLTRLLSSITTLQMQIPCVFLS